MYVSVCEDVHVSASQSWVLCWHVCAHTMVPRERSGSPVEMKFISYVYSHVFAGLQPLHISVLNYRMT